DPVVRVGLAVRDRGDRRVLCAGAARRHAHRGERRYSDSGARPNSRVFHYNSCISHDLKLTGAREPPNWTFGGEMPGIPDRQRDRPFRTTPAALLAEWRTPALIGDRAVTPSARYGPRAIRLSRLMYGTEAIAATTNWSSTAGATSLL